MTRSYTLPPLELLPPAYVAENTSYPLFATCIAFLVIETFFMTLLYTSRFLSSDKKANWHMVALMTGAYIVCLGKITIGLLAVKIGGAGRHLETLPLPTIQIALKLNTALQLICPLTTSLTKMAILCLFHTIFGATSARYRLVIRATFILCLVTTLVQVIIPLANCKPFSATWTFGGESACAIDGLYLWKYLSIPNVITTIIVVCIPIPAMYKLQISLATKVGLGVVLSVCICGYAVVLDDCGVGDVYGCRGFAYFEAVDEEGVWWGGV
ncbi:hypothetical protein GRF29_216g1042375 [Pseudopithomyces chartarum]|uniref:Rhodopsin domain-containing protein n=1 Tax=Pseudopithomyces chartarum TaxID=1892770 RepID=A0AAN6LMB6_9PLEO|nr:hypothetical protein GRF29_216g1042375 [Pseudopithomyces chartarum]